MVESVMRVYTNDIDCGSIGCDACVISSLWGANGSHFIGNTSCKNRLPLISVLTILRPDFEVTLSKSREVFYINQKKKVKECLII